MKTPGRGAHMSRRAIGLLAAIVLCAALVGLWWGEALTLMPDGAVLACALVCTAGAVLVPAKRRPWRILAGAAATAAFWIAWWAGREEATAAFDDCVAAGESIREALATHESATGTFPAALSELPRSVPGRRLLRGSMWRYARTENGYELCVRDALVTHCATHVEAFRAHK